MQTKREVLKIVKDTICRQDDYSYGEEELLCMMALNLTKEQLYKLESFNFREVKRIKRALYLRKTGEPLNKIFKRQNFFGIDFFVNKNVLAPRVETEILVEKALQSIKTANKNVLDLCCGSGCIGLTVAKLSKIPVKVVLADIDDKALAVCRKNQKKLNIDNVTILKSNLYSRLKKFSKFDIIICNPPYIKTADIKSLSKSVKNFDPHISLDGGHDGLEFYRKIAEISGEFLASNGKILLEIGYDQGADVQSIFSQNGFETKCFKDYSNNDRVVEVRKRKE